MEGKSKQSWWIINAEQGWCVDTSDLWMRQGSICKHQLWVSLQLDRIYEDIFNVRTEP